MAIALIGHKEAHAANSPQTAGLDTRTADFIAALVATYTSAPATLLDSKSNSWNALTSRTGGGVRVTLYWVVPGSKVDVAHTFTASGNGSYSVVEVMAFSGVDQTTPFNSGSDVGATGGFPRQTGSLTVNDGDLAITGAGADGGSGWAVDSGFSIQDSVSYTGGTCFGGAFAYLIKSGTGALNPQWTGVGSQGTGGLGMFSVKAAAAAGGIVIPVLSHSYRQRRR